MLLKRRIGEGVMIGDILVKLVAIDRGKAKLGIEAPRDMAVDREEIFHAKRRDKQKEVERAKRDEGQSAGEQGSKDAACCEITIDDILARHGE